MLISDRYGLVIFNIEKGNEFIDKTELHEEIFNNMEARLNSKPVLTTAHSLGFGIYKEKDWYNYLRIKNFG